MARHAVIGLLAGGWIAILSGFPLELSLLAAQRNSARATLSGVVVGPDDRPVAHAGITYQSSSGRAPHALHTDSHGRFTVTKLRADNYDVRASARGIFSEWEKNVTLRPGESRFLTLRLIYSRQNLESKPARKPKP